MLQYFSDIDRKCVKIFGEKEEVDKVRSNVRNVLKKIQKKQADPSYVRQYRGTKALLQATLKEKAKTPSYWTKNTGMFSKVVGLLSSSILQDVDAKTKDAVEKLVHGTWQQQYVGQGKDAVGLGKYQIQISKIQRIENPDAYKRYRIGINFACEEGLSEEYKEITTLSGEGEVMTRLQNQAILEGSLLPEINEYFLFHGTKKEFVNHLVQQ